MQDSWLGIAVVDRYEGSLPKYLTSLQHPVVQRVLGGENITPENRHADPRYWSLRITGDPLEAHVSDALIRTFSRFKDGTHVLSIGRCPGVAYTEEPTENPFIKRLRSAVAYIDGVYRLNIETAPGACGFPTPNRFWLTDISDQFDL